MRCFTCKEKKTTITQHLIEQLCGTGTNETQRSMVAILLNAVHWRIIQQRTTSLEKISSSHHENIDEKPSDDIAMHRICGWALFSASDHLKRVKDEDQKKPANPQRLSITKQFDFATSLKLSNEDKQLLPNPVKYLDRGGLTFLKRSLWPWMNSLERKMVQYLNERCYRAYGDKLFHVTHTALASDVTLLNEFVTGAKESSTQATVWRTTLLKVCIEHYWIKYVMLGVMSFYVI